MFVFAAGYEGTITNLQIVLNIPKTLLKSYYPKKYLPNIPSPPKILESKISNPKNPSIIPVTLNPEHLLPALGPGSLSFKYVK